MTAAGKPVARYDDWADWYERYMNGEAREFAQRASDALAGVLGPGTGPVLDLACGTGTYARVLAGLGWAPFGLDLSMAQLRYARGRMPVIAADAAVLPLRPGTLAAVSAVMCHTDIDDYTAVCQALSPALQPGGIFAHVGVPLLRRGVRRPIQPSRNRDHPRLLAPGAAPGLVGTPSTSTDCGQHRA